MNNSEYTKLNNYLNELFIYLQEYFKPFIDNLIPIFELNDKFSILLKGYDLEDASIQNDLTYDDVYLLAEEIISTIDKKYLDDFDNLIKSGELDFSYNNDYYDSHFIHTKNYNLININRSYNYDDVVVLIHEFFHYLTGKGQHVTENWHWLTEFFSIYFESYAINYLIDNGVPKNEIKYKARLKSTYRRTNDMYFIESPLLSYHFFGVISDSSYQLLDKFRIVNVTKEVFEQECKNLLYWFRKEESNYKLENFKQDYSEYGLRLYYGDKFKNYFSYFFGTVLAFYAIENCDMENILKINDKINDENLDFFECISEMGIDIFNDNFNDEVIESIKKYLINYNIEKGDLCKKNSLAKD